MGRIAPPPVSLVRFTHSLQTSHFIGGMREWLFGCGYRGDEGCEGHATLRAARTRPPTPALGPDAGSRPGVVVLAAGTPPGGANAPRRHPDVRPPADVSGLR